MLRSLANLSRQATCRDKEYLETSDQWWLQLITRPGRSSRKRHPDDRPSCGAVRASVNVGAWPVVRQGNLTSRPHQKKPRQRKQLRFPKCPNHPRRALKFIIPFMELWEPYVEPSGGPCARRDCCHPLKKRETPNTPNYGQHKWCLSTRRQATRATRMTLLNLLPSLPLPRMTLRDCLPSILKGKCDLPLPRIPNLRQTAAAEEARCHRCMFA